MVPQTQKGIAIFIAVITVSALMLIAVSISNLSYKEQLISFSGRDSKVAFYAADAGADCALFHDLKGGFDGDVQFSTPSEIVDTTVKCNEDGDPINADVTSDTSSVTTTFYFNLPGPPSACSIVTVTKTNGTDGIDTTIESSGYNTTCSGSQSSPSIAGGSTSRNLERTIKITY